MSAGQLNEVGHLALDLLTGRRLVVVGGAGVSTDSGIPDYRGPRPAGAAQPAMPMTYQEFVASAAAQQRYWARAHLGWSRMGSAKPNDGHRALAQLDPELLITQNVDGLHERAGSRRLVALHGRISDVICLDCRQVTSRTAMQERLTAANPEWLGQHSAYAAAHARPDGDVALEETAEFVVPACRACGGRLKPDVVFFGENVPKHRVERSYAAVDSLATQSVLGALLVVGSSLTVMSGLRFVKRAAQLNLPIVIVNRSATRGDSLATHKVHAGVTEFVTALLSHRNSAYAEVQ